MLYSRTFGKFALCLCRLPFELSRVWQIGCENLAKKNKLCGGKNTDKIKILWDKIARPRKTL